MDLQPPCVRAGMDLQSPCDGKGQTYSLLVVGRVLGQTYSPEIFSKIIKVFVICVMLGLKPSVCDSSGECYRTMPQPPLILILRAGCVLGPG